MTASAVQLFTEGIENRLADCFFELMKDFWTFVHSIQYLLPWWYRCQQRYSCKALDRADMWGPGVCWTKRLTALAGKKKNAEIHKSSNKTIPSFPREKTAAVDPTRPETETEHYYTSTREREIAWQTGWPENREAVVIKQKVIRINGVEPRAGFYNRRAGILQSHGDLKVETRTATSNYLHRSWTDGRTRSKPSTGLCTPPK